MFFFGPEWDHLLTPTLGRITTAGDTIWLSGHDFDGRTVAYFLVRPGARWTRVDGPPPVARTRRAEALSDTGFALDGGARLRVVTARREGDTAFATLTLADGRTVPLRATIPGRMRAGLALRGWFSPEETADGEPDFGSISPVPLVTPRAYWFGIDGGFSEGFGALGGLVRVDRATGALAVIAHSWLGDVSITSMIAIGDTLFLGTMRRGEYGPWGTEGLIRYEPGRDRWLRDTVGPGALPDLLIWSVARVGDSLAVTTGTGAAIRPLAGGPWTPWHFKPQINDTSVSLDLVPLADTATRVEVVARYLWQEHLIPRPADFARRFTRLSAERQRELLYASTGIRALDDTLFIPEIVAALRDSARQYQRVEIAAQLAVMHHPLANLAVRGALVDGDALATSAAAIRLLAAGDTATRSLVARRMQGTADEFQWALAVAVGAHDDRWLPAIVRRLAGADDALRSDIYGALSLLGTPAAVRQLFAFAESDRLARQTLFAVRGDTAVPGASAWARADTARAARAIVLALADRDDRSPRAIPLAARFRVGPAIPRLIDRLRWHAATPEGPVYDMRARAEMGELSRALVSLTGQRGAPMDHEGFQFGTRANDFWQRWRASAGTALVQAVPPTLGAPAVTRVPPPVVASAEAALTARGKKASTFRREEDARDREAMKASLAAGLRIRRLAAPDGWASLRP